MSTAQERFDTTYISSTEIMRELNVTRSAMLHARNRGLLPDPIVVNEGHLHIWERQTIRPYVDAWKLILKVRRNEVV